jgi:hypothetical protein
MRVFESLHLPSQGGIRHPDNRRSVDDQRMAYGRREDMLIAALHVLDVVWRRDWRHCDHHERPHRHVESKTNPHRRSANPQCFPHAVIIGITRVEASKVPRLTQNRDL